jgi:hypothetical protein
MRIGITTEYFVKQKAKAWLMDMLSLIYRMAIERTFVEIYEL